MSANRPHLTDLRGMDAAQVAQLPADQLALLLDEVGEIKAEAKRLADLLNDALHIRYGAAAAALRQATNRDTGRVRITDNGFDVVADLVKRVEWNQPLLADAVTTIRGWGESAEDYVTTEIRVPESRYTAWPPRLRALFEPARTVAPGRPSYAFERRNG